MTTSMSVNLKYFSEVSAKNGYKINELFEEVAKTVYKDYCLANSSPSSLVTSLFSSSSILFPTKIIVTFSSTSAFI